MARKKALKIITKAFFIPQLSPCLEEFSSFAFIVDDSEMVGEGCRKENFTSSRAFVDDDDDKRDEMESDWHASRSFFCWCRLKPTSIPFGGNT